MWMHSKFLKQRPIIEVHFLLQLVKANEPVGPENAKTRISLIASMLIDEMPVVERGMDKIQSKQALLASQQI